MDEVRAHRVWYAIRTITLVPVVCAAMLIALWVSQAEVFAGLGHFLGLMASLVALPLAVYPLKRLARSREGHACRGERFAAIVFAVSGYALACLVNILAGAGKAAWMICLEYMVGGAVIFLFNRLMYVNISGHIAGVAGPVLLMTAFGVPWALPVGIGALALVALACLKTKMHTVWEMLAGCSLAAAVFWPLYVLL